MAERSLDLTQYWDLRILKLVVSWTRRYNLELIRYPQNRSLQFLTNLLYPMIEFTLWLQQWVSPYPLRWIYSWNLPHKRVHFVLKLLKLHLIFLSSFYLRTCFSLSSQKNLLDWILSGNCQGRNILCTLYSYLWVPLEYGAMNLIHPLLIKSPTLWVILLVSSVWSLLSSYTKWSCILSRRNCRLVSSTLKAHLFFVPQKGWRSLTVLLAHQYPSLHYECFELFHHAHVIWNSTRACLHQIVLGSLSKWHWSVLMRWHQKIPAVS